MSTLTLSNETKAQKRTGFKTRMHSSMMMRTDRCRGCRGRGALCLRLGGISVQGGPCLRESLSGVSFHVGEGGLCTDGGFLSRGAMFRGSLFIWGRGVSVQGASLSGETTSSVDRITDRRFRRYYLPLRLVIDLKTQSIRQFTIAC